MPTYAMTTTINAPLADVKERVTAALKNNGFGVLTEINMAATLKDRIGAEIPSYEILGACNPNLAHKAVTLEPSIGLLLPCNVTLRDVDGKTEVSIIDPKMMIAVVDEAVQRELEPVMQEARSLLQTALNELSE